MVALPERQTLQKPLRVLLVEDSENDALLLLRELGRAGYEVEHERVLYRRGDARGAPITVGGDHL